MNKRTLALVAVLALAVTAVAIPAAAQAVNTLKSVTLQKTDKGIDVALAIDGEFLYQAQPLSNPARLAIDLSPLSKIDAPPYVQVNQGGLTEIRTSQFSPMIVRVVIDFSGALPGYEIAKTDTGLIIRFSPEAKPAARPAVAAPVREQPLREQPLEQVKPAETEAEAGEGRDGFANTMIGVGLGSYQIPAERFKEIYGGDATPTYGLSLSRTLVQYEGLSLDVEGGIRDYSKTGSSTLSQETATFKMTPKSLSFRLNYQWKFFQVFVGGGGDWYRYTETSAIQTTTGDISGSHFTAGVYLIPPVLDSMLRVKLYYKFTKIKTAPDSFNLNGVELGGNEYGIGLSFGFNFFKKGILSF
jgi:hypothetical protein